jgi:hypothetical protein
MTTTVTFAAMLAALACAALCLWRGLSATKIGRVRLIPWIPLGLFFVVVGFMLLVHLLNLYGMDTGRGR